MHPAKSRTLRGVLSREDGSVVLITALLLVVSLGFAGLVIDFSRGRTYVRAAQEGVDSAALAGAQDFFSFPGWPAVVSRVENYVAANRGIPVSSWTGCTDNMALAYLPDAANSDTCISADASSGSTRLRVRLPDTKLPTTFGQVLGVMSLSISAGATAKVVTASPCALCVLSPSASPAFDANGTAQVTIYGGGLTVDSTAGSAATVIGQAGVSATAIGGPAAPNGFETSGNGTYYPTPTQEAPVPDPLAGVLQCPGAGTSVCPTNQEENVKLTSSGSSATIWPGIYSTISVSGGGSLTMEPGTYIITQGISFSGNGSLTANGVTLYMACSMYPTPCLSTGEAGATFSITGNGSTSITPPTSGPFQGLTIFDDRNNTDTNSSLNGNGGTLLTGTVYAKSIFLTITGNGSATTLDSVIITNTSKTSGNAALNINYVASQNAPITLVELVQ